MSVWLSSGDADVRSSAGMSCSNSLSVCSPSSTWETAAAAIRRLVKRITTVRMTTGCTGVSSDATFHCRDKRIGHMFGLCRFTTRSTQGRKQEDWK